MLLLCLGACFATSVHYLRVGSLQFGIANFCNLITPDVFSSRSSCTDLKKFFLVTEVKGLSAAGISSSEESFNTRFARFFVPLGMGEGDFDLGQFSCH